jgi:hypothetical protein
MPVSASMLATWADVDQRACQETFPRFVRELILISGSIAKIDMPSEDGIQTAGWDGIVHTRKGNPWVPVGVSRWEIGTGKDISDKANAEFTKRSTTPGSSGFRKEVFVFITPRRWAKKREWSSEKQKSNLWREVRAYDAEDFAQWLHAKDGRRGELSSRFLKQITTSVFGESVASEALDTHGWIDNVCRSVDFSGDGSIAGLVGVRPFSPADVKCACLMPCHRQDVRDLLRSGTLAISDSPGQGKTTRAFNVGYQLAQRGYRVYLINCISLARIGCRYIDLVSFLEYLDGIRAKRVLILEDAHRVRDFEIPELIGLSRKSTLVVYTHVRDSDLSHAIVGGRIEDLFPADEDAWRISRTMLLEWIDEHRLVLESMSYSLSHPVLERLESATSCWHFFYILRGGTASIASDCAHARANNRWDLLYFVVCALRFFEYKDCGYYEILEICNVRNWPHPKMPVAERAGWVRSGLQWLTENHLIARESSSFVPRHYFEAAAVMRQMQTSAPDKSELHTLAIDLLGGVLAPFEMSPHERNAIVHGKKYEAKEVLYRVEAFIDKAHIFDLGLVPSPELENFYASIWAELAQCISKADVHHLYWMGNNIPSLNYGTMLYPPPRFVSGTLNIKCELGGDSIDFATFIDAAIGRQAIELIGERYRYAELCARMLSNTDRLEIIRRMMSYANEGLSQGQSLPPVATAKSGRKKVRKLKKRRKSEEDPLSMAMGNLDRPKILEIMVIGDEEDREDMEHFEARVLSVVSASLLPALETRRYDLIGQRVLAATLSNLDARRSAVQRLTNNIDVNAIGLMTRDRGDGAPIILFHLWLASSERARVFYGSLTSAAKHFVRKSVRKISRERDRYSGAFHADTTSVLFMAFVRWLAEVDLAIRSWYEDVCKTDELRGRFERDSLALEDGVGVEADVLTLRKFSDAYSVTRIETGVGRAFQGIRGVRLRYAAQLAQVTLPELLPERLLGKDLTNQPCVVLRGGVPTFAGLSLAKASKPMTERFLAADVQNNFPNLAAFDLARMRFVEVACLGGELALIPHRQGRLEVPFFMSDGAVILAARENTWLYLAKDKTAPPQPGGDLCAYVRIFLTTVVGKSGRFRPADSLDDVNWLPAAGKDIKQKFEQSVTPLALAGKRADGQLELRGTVIFKNALLLTSVLVAPSWELRMADEELLIENLPIKHGLKNDLLLLR